VIRVFVSSVSKGLVQVRKQIIDDLRTAGFDVGAMEQFGAQAEAPLEVCLRDLRKSDVVVLIVGPRYGSLIPQGISYTQAEFREARGAGIPVLAFRVLDASDLPEREKEQLSAFLAEVGSTTTYASLLPTESQDCLSGKIQAALAAAKDRGELGSRYSPFQQFDRFFAQQLGPTKPLFNHEGPYIGRDSELAQLVLFLQGNDRVLLLKAPGGSGKSRLLLEAARTAGTKSGMPRVLFVDIAAQWTAEDINRLPVGPLVLVFDDAHRRADLDRIIAASLLHNPIARFVVSCRPSAVNIVRPYIALLLDGVATPEIELAPLNREHSEDLARHHLPKELHHLASRLVQIADRNPLVISVGARCVAEKRVSPDVLERTPEVFRALVLDRLLNDPGLRTQDEATSRKILEVLAAVGPVSTEPDEFITALAKVTGAAEHNVRRILASLEKAAFLGRRGRLVRVSPDVLADHLLYRAAVDENGKPTGFVESMVATFSPALLENILANAAELDWRAAATAKHESVLTRTWKDLLSALPSATSPQRAQVVGQLKRAAVFAPEEVLRIAEWLADHPDAPPDESLALWGLKDGPDRVIDALTEIFGFIATHPNFAEKCIQRLWQFAENDTRPTNPNPGHPRRRLADFLKYDRGSDWHIPEGVQVKAIRYFINRLQDPKRKEDAAWAIGILGSALGRLGEANESNRREFTIRQFSLAGYIEQIRERRHQTMELLRQLAIGSRPGEAAAALKEISKTLQAPQGPFGKELNPEEIAVWQPEAERAIAILTETATASPSEAVRYFARRALRQASSDRWPAITQTLRTALRDTPPLPSEPLYDLLVGIPWEEQLDDYQEEERRVDWLCRAAAEVSWREKKTANAVVRQILEGEAALEAVSSPSDSHTSRLVRAIADVKPDHAESVVRALAGSGEPGWRLLRPAILSLHEKQPAAAIKIVEELTQSNDERLRAYAADPMQWMIESPTAQTVLDIARKLSGDISPVVRKVIAHVLRRFCGGAAAEAALSTLVAIDWGADVSLASAVLDVLHPKYGLDPGKLSNDDIDRLLSRIDGVQSLEGRAHDVLEFIAFASTRRPMQTIEMLLRRVRAVEEHSGSRGEDRRTPLPYNGHGLTLPGIAKAPNHVELLRLVRDTYLNASVMVRFWLPTLFGAATSDLPEAIEVLREWVQSGDQEKIVGAAHLLHSWEHSIVFSVHDFVADLLDAADKLGPECLQRVRSELFGTAISGAHSGTPGQPAPRHLSDKASAQALATQYASRPAVKDFYDTLVRHAEGSIERDLMRWEEVGDD
jgi:hypothetical protein